MDWPACRARSSATPVPAMIVLMARSSGEVSKTQRASAAPTHPSGQPAARKPVSPQAFYRKLAARPDVSKILERLAK